MLRRAARIVILFAIFCLLIVSDSSKSVSSSDNDEELTDEFYTFLNTRIGSSSRDRSENADSYGFLLSDGKLSISNADGREIWVSKQQWYVSTFRIMDINADGILDVAFVVWKSFSFGNAHPARMQNDDRTVRCHLFVYSVKDERIKALWCSSNLPRPIYSFELDNNGEKTTVSSGVRLITQEGTYTEDYSLTSSKEYIYQWEGWGFSPIETLNETAKENAIDIANEAANETTENTNKERDLRTATIAVVGDLMCHKAQWVDAYAKGNGSYDFDYSFKYIKPCIKAADYAIGNLETTIVLPTNQPSDYPDFAAPASFAKAIKDSGFDMVTTANNHAYDFGKEGLLNTLQTLDEIGLAHTGTFSTEEESGKITIINVNGISFAFLSYTQFMNGNAAIPDMPWGVNLATEEKIKTDIESARKLNSDFVIVFIHMGIEYETSPSAVVKEKVRTIADAGADAVLVSHPHVLQPVEFIEAKNPDGTLRKVFVAYSLGNFISSQQTDNTDYGMITYLKFNKTSEGEAALESVELLPTWVKITSVTGENDIMVLPINNLEDPKLEEEIKNLRPKDLERIKEVKKEFGESLIIYPNSAAIR
ncbi:MAG: CapA family protein [Lachnospiraceae bacterium]|jgi:poly-gamma-glutamate synthesis protein (capsule biosynthesis protein)|nr:CapA family protein [Lachnospiraceae bacterium]